MSFVISRSAYYRDFFVVPLAIAALLAAQLLEGWGGIARWLYLVPLGGLFWSLAEYWLHRLLFHGRGHYAADHHLHHVRPVEFIGASPHVTLIIATALYVVLLLVFELTTAGGLMAGILAWYGVYIYSHDRYHHYPPRKGTFWYAQMQRHRAHHRGSDVHYGVSSPLWDMVFGTYSRVRTK